MTTIEKQPKDKTFRNGNGGELVLPVPPEGYKWEIYADEYDGWGDEDPYVNIRLTKTVTVQVPVSRFRMRQEDKRYYTQGHPVGPVDSSDNTPEAFYRAAEKELASHQQNLDSANFERISGTYSPCF